MGLGRCHPRGSGTAIPLPRPKPPIHPGGFFVSLAILGIFFGGQSLDKCTLSLCQLKIQCFLSNTEYGVEIRPLLLHLVVSLD